MSSGIQAQVLYEYEAHDDDQLSIKPGDIVTIIDDSQDLNGWALAQKGDKEGYVPAEYVRYIDQPIDNGYTGDTWKAAGFESYYQNVLSQEHNLPFTFKLTKSLRDVLIPCPCSRFGYVMSRGSLRRGAIISLIFSFIVSLVDFFSLISFLIPFNTNHKSSPHALQIILFLLNVIIRIVINLYFIHKYPRQNLNLVSFPFLNIIASLTFSIRVYESLEMGDNKEYDGYRYYRSWMWSSIINLPFLIINLILICVDKSKFVGMISVGVLIIVMNLLNIGRCFLASWANVESGNDIHPDFEQTIKKYNL